MKDLPKIVSIHWAPSQYPKRRLFVRSRKVSKPRDWYFKLSYRFEIWQAHRQHSCRSACLISKRSDNSKYKSRGFTSVSISVSLWSKTLHWRHNERDDVSNHRRLDCLLNCLSRRRSKKTSKLRVICLCEGNSPVTGEFPAQRTRNTENVSIWWRHHETIQIDWISATFAKKIKNAIYIIQERKSATKY